MPLKWGGGNCVHMEISVVNIPHVLLQILNLLQLGNSQQDTLL